jgi:hypothetical protein
MQIFICFEYESNQFFVDELCEALKEIEVLPQITNLKLKFGNELSKNVDEALRGCEHVIMVISQGFTRSKWHQKELFAFLLKEERDDKKLIIPVLLEDCDYNPLLEDRICDFRGKTFKEGFKLIAKQISLSRQVFVAMKFGDPVLDSAYEGVIRPVIEDEFKYTVLRVDEIQDSGKITDQILKELGKSEIVLVDLTGERPNCYYEAGYAHALEKKVIFTLKRGEKVHFDLSGYRYIEWSTEQELREQLRKRFQNIYRKRKPRYAKYKAIH